MKQTRSGDYELPGHLGRWIGNFLILAAPYLPKVIRNRHLRRRAYYQVFEGDELGTRQGLSINKWSAMQMPASLTGKAVLDIGCADGFFCHLCSQRGASSVLGIDTAIGRLLRARLMALGQGLNIEYRFDIFPSQRLHRKFDYVLCLSVLHHSLASKDIWKVLTDTPASEDLAILRGHLKALRNVTAADGKAIIEMPYEYDDLAERNIVDFELFTKELIKAGFRNARCLGDWEHNAKLKAIKDRMIYVAEM